MENKSNKNLLFYFTILIILFFSSSGSALYENSNFVNNSEDLISLKSIVPPPISIRQPAEFEPMEGFLINYGGNDNFGISIDIIAEMAEEVEVVTIVDSMSQQNIVESIFLNNGINLDHCSFLIAPSDSHWTRDYGPWFAFTGDDELAVIDFSYNRPRPNDNAIPSAYANNEGMEIYTMSLEHTGGNYMTDGQGISVSTNLVWSENSGMSHSEIDQIVSDYLGINRYHVVPDVNGEYIKHIDCWGKYLSPDVIMIREVSPTHSQYDEIEAAVDYFELQNSCYGTPYTIVRVYTPNNEPYTNSLILNKKVLVPTYGNQWDVQAIESYEDAMPGYEVLGFNGSWYSTDALHCRVKGIPDREMLYIEHTPLQGEQSGNNGFEIVCKIKPYSGENVKIGPTCIYYKINNGEWNNIRLESIGNDYYNAIIPIQEDGAVVKYYIHAEDNSGRIENHPYIGASDAHSFIVDNPSTPNSPTKPNGPKKGLVNLLYNYSTVSTDPNNDTIQYGWDWDGDDKVDQWSDFFESGAIMNISHSWSETGVYFVKVKAKDIDNHESGFSPILTVTISDNNPPDVPSNPTPYFGTNINLSKIISNYSESNYDPGLLEHDTKYYWKIVAWDNKNEYAEGSKWVFTTLKPNNPPIAPSINGPASGKVGIEYNYTFKTIDPENDDVYYYIEWGDGAVEEWIGAYNSRENVTISHTWEIDDDYIISVKAKDTEGAESNWSTLEIIIPKIKDYFNWNLLEFFEGFFEYFTFLKQLLNLFLI
jgi:agmatine/peptidylarginine deiminase